jgi:hypothetical protein
MRIAGPTVLGVDFEECDSPLNIALINFRVVLLDEIGDNMVHWKLLGHSIFGPLGTKPRIDLPVHENESSYVWKTNRIARPPIWERLSITFFHRTYEVGTGVYEVRPSAGISSPQRRLKFPMTI